MKRILPLPLLGQPVTEYAIHHELDVYEEYIHM